AHLYHFKYDVAGAPQHQAMHQQFLPGVPKLGINHSISGSIGPKVRFSMMHFYQSAQYLNDQNTVKEKGYIIGNVNVEGRLNYKKMCINPYISCYNIYNTHYSAGYDIN